MGRYALGLRSFPSPVPLIDFFPGRTIRDRKIDTWISAPSVVDLMTRSGEASVDYLGKVERFVFCGEALLPEQVKTIFDAAPNAHISNTCGPAEATVSYTKMILTRGNYRAASDASMATGETIAGIDIVLQGGPPAGRGRNR